MTTKRHAHDEATGATDAPSAEPLPTLTPDEYWTRRRALEAELAALEIALVVSQRYPAWRYHATEPPVIVASETAADALGAGWAETPVAPEPPPPVPAESQASTAHWDLPGR